MSVVETIATPELKTSLYGVEKTGDVKVGDHISFNEYLSFNEQRGRVISLKQDTEKTDAISDDTFWVEIATGPEKTEIIPIKGNQIRGVLLMGDAASSRGLKK